MYCPILFTHLYCNRQKANAFRTILSTTGHHLRKQALVLVFQQLYSWLSRNVYAWSIHRMLRQEALGYVLNCHLRVNVNPQEQ
jgi:hypothetical protein